MPDQTDELKKAAAWEAVKRVESGMRLGLGHGSTAIHALRRIAELLQSGELRDIAGVPCSRLVETQARELGIPLISLEDHPVLDLTIDGADEVSVNLDLIKGGGGALLREKIVAQASRREIIICDDGKLSRRLGERWGPAGGGAALWLARPDGLHHRTGGRGWPGAWPRMASRF